MPTGIISPYAYPHSRLRIRQGAPPFLRPTREEIDSYPEASRRLVRDIWLAQKALVEGTQSHDVASLQVGGMVDLTHERMATLEPTATIGTPTDVWRYRLEYVSNTHFLIAGGTGQGIGGALAVALLHLICGAGSITVVSRDLSRSLGHEMGRVMQELAQKYQYGERFTWLNSGLASEGKDFEEIVAALRRSGAKEIVYINTVAAANSGLLPGYPTVYVTDVDEQGPFLWELLPLDRRSIDATRHTMGTLAVEFPQALERAGIRVAATAFTDWRGSLDRESRDPASPFYGRQGSYSTSLFLPKDIIQEATSRAYGSGRVVLDFFLPVMRTRALPFIPGGQAMAQLYEGLMRRAGVRHVGVPELALALLDRMGQSLQRPDENPFPRLDAHEAQFDLWFHELVWRLNGDENSEFFYRRWLNGEETEPGAAGTALAGSRTGQ